MTEIDLNDIELTVKHILLYHKKWWYNLSSQKFKVILGYKATSRSVWDT